jgi:type I restriction enzyme, S subunit
MRIADLGRVVTGRTPPGNDAAYYGGDVPFLTPSDMLGQQRVQHTARSLSRYGVQQLNRCLISSGVGVSCIGWQMGKAILIDRPTITNQQINSIIIDSELADPLFVYYSLVGRRDELFNLGAGGSRTPILNKGDFERLPFTLPPLPQQRVIAHILGTLDDKIELNRRMSETLEAMARALFKSWFVDFDPVRAKAEGRDPGLPQPLADLFPARLVDSELGEIPEGWEVRSLPKAIEVNPVRSLRKGDVAPYLDMANMPTRGHTPDAVVRRPFGSGMRFMNGDTLVARITPCLENGKTAFVDFLEDGQVGWGSTEYIVLRPKPPLPGEFAYCLVRSAQFRDFAIQSMTGSSGRQRVPVESLEHFLLTTFPEPVAEAFGRAVTPLFARASEATAESHMLAALRDALLPKLISGELRVQNAEKLIEGLSDG